MLSNKVRQSYLDFFRSKDHHIVPSAPVIPAQDPTLLFTNAGMNQFKEVFLNTGKREYKRIADSQKCIRVGGKHNDLEEVGVDTSHHTFFEMLGNWSFGDYYKKEAITWAWELFTEVWKLDKNRLYATVFETDDESEELWYSETDIIRGRVTRLGKKDNFWEMGETGPCGPCSEIHYDNRDNIEPGKNFLELEAAGESVELWNLVFIQYNRLPDQSLEELPNKHVDTGMGFERITAILQGKTSNYDTDLFMPIIETIQDITGKEYNENSREGVAFRVLSDHIRALTFAITDGALPSNDGRGYVLRRILRRAARYGRELDMHKPFIYNLVSPVVDILGEAYPEIKGRANYVSHAIKSEEVGFGNTLDRGIEIFNNLAEKAGKTGKSEISGDDAFQLYDTYGFPLDLTELMAREQNLTVNLDGFNSEMDAQKTRSYSKKKMPGAGELKGSEIETLFSYLDESLEVEIASIFNEQGENKNEASAEEKVDIQFSGITPFYAESGGQIGDTGKLESSDGKIVIEITDTQKAADKVIFHSGKIVKGNLKTGDRVLASVDSGRRLAIKRNHTATHLLHFALRDILGEHVRQAGSLVAPSYLRFDFNHFHKISDEELNKLENMVNNLIRKNYSVQLKEDVPFNEAKEKGAIALFGEKYGDKVRTAAIGDFSLELCGGTHIEKIGLIGEFRIVSESAVASGVRRIIAETGDYASKRGFRERAQLAQVMEILNANENDVVEKIDSLIEQRKSLEKELRDSRKETSQNQLDDLIKKAKSDLSAGSADSVSLITEKFSAASVDELKEIGDIIRGKMPQGAALIGSVIDGKAMLVCLLGDSLIKEKNWNAGQIVKELAKRIGGGGGGKPHMAAAGIKDPGKMNEAFEIFSKVLESLYGKN